MDIVAGTSAFLAVTLGEPERASIQQLTIGHELIAPQVLPFEIGNALSAMLRQGRLECESLPKIWQAVGQIEVDLRPVDMAAALDIVTRYRIHAYDAYFLEIASRHRLPLLTLDRHMKSIASQLHIDCLE
jgi:predicted nucleic acid-binding protein